MSTPPHAMQPDQENSRRPMPESVEHPIPSVAYQRVGYFLSVFVVLTACACIYLADSQWFWQDDYQSYQLANYWEVGRSLSEGEFPLLTPFSWECAALAGEYQNGVFSILISALAYLMYTLSCSFPFAAAVFSTTHLAVLAAGTYRLARIKQVSVAMSLFVAWNTAFSGWIMIWGARAWFPALASFAWLPWFWGSLEMAVRRAPDWGNLRGIAKITSLARLGFPAAFFLYLIITAGWPFTVLMAGLLSAWVGMRQFARWEGMGAEQGVSLRQKRSSSHSEDVQADGRALQLLETITCRSVRLPRSIAAIAAIWVLGLGLSAPAWMMLLEYTAETLRGQSPATQLEDDWTVPILALPGLFLPALRVTWNVFGSIKEHTSVELAGGLLPISVMIAACLSARRHVLRHVGWELSLVIVVLLLSIWPSMGAFRWSFRWLPLAILVLSLAAGRCLPIIFAARQSLRLNPGQVGAMLVALAWIGSALWDWNGPGWVNPGLTLQGSLLVGCLFGWGCVWNRSASLEFLSRSAACLSLLIAFVSLGLPQPPLEYPVWDAPELVRRLPLEAHRRYLSIHEWSDLFDTDPKRVHRPIRASHRALMPGNFNQYQGIEFINGYSPMQPLGLHALFRIGPHGYLGVADPRGCDSYLQPALDLISREAGREGVLQWMGVDGIVVADQHRHLIPSFHAQGWHTAHVLSGSTVLHRNEVDSRSVRIVESAELLDDWKAVDDQMAWAQKPVNVRRRTWPVYMPNHRGQEATRFVSSIGAQVSGKSFANANLGNVVSRRNSVQVEIQRAASSAEVLVVFSRPWFPGYRATFNGKQIPVGRFCNLMPSVIVPAGQSGSLQLSYFPRSLQTGMWIVAATTLWLLGAVVTRKCHCEVVDTLSAPGRGAVEC